MSCTFGPPIRYAHDTPDSVSTPMSDQLPRQLLRVHAIRLGSFLTPVDFDRCGIHDHVLDASLHQSAMQPEAFSSDLVTAPHRCRFDQIKTFSGQLDLALQSLPLSGRSGYGPCSARAAIAEREFPCRPAEFKSDISCQICVCDKLAYWGCLVFASHKSSLRFFERLSKRPLSFPLGQARIGSTGICKHLPLEDVRK